VRLVLPPKILRRYIFHFQSCLFVILFSYYIHLRIVWADLQEKEKIMLGWQLRQYSSEELYLRNFFVLEAQKCIIVQNRDSHNGASFGRIFRKGGEI
jgi:hypothetical protein